jgi:hypothetical protein
MMKREEPRSRTRDATPPRCHGLLHCPRLADQVNEPLPPVGAQVVAFGMILVGVAALRAKVWRGWRVPAPFVVGLYFYLVPFVGFIPMGTGKPPHTPCSVVGSDLDTARICRLFKRDLAAAGGRS